MPPSDGPKRLTEAQTRALRWFAIRPAPVRMIPENFAIGTLDVLVRLGLVDRRVPDGASHVLWSATDRGRGVAEDVWQKS